MRKEYSAALLTRYSARVPNAPTSRESLILESTEIEFRRASGFELRVPALTLAAGESLAVRGPSGCGKSTLLSLLSGELTPSRGSIRVGDLELSRARDSVRRDFRATRCGQVFQTFELVPSLHVLANVLLPFRLHPSLTLNAAATARAHELLLQVGLRDAAHRRIHELSHGERQRVAIARALVNEPRLLLADEPTGNLDPTLKFTIAQLLIDSARRAGAALIVATHDERILPCFDRVIDLGGAA